MQDWEEVIFDNRNKLYGSYVLRKKYFKYLIIGLFLAIVLVVAPVGILYLHYQKKALLDDIPISVSVDLTHPIDLDKLLLEPPPPPVKEPVEENREKLPVVTDSVKETTEQAKKAAPTVLKDSVAKTEPQKAPRGDSLMDKNDTSSFLYVDELPEPFGGKEELSRFIRRNLVVPEVAGKKRIKGIIVIQFVVSRNGDVQDVKLISGIDPVLDSEAIHVIRILPRWKPAKRGGKPIPFKYKIPINLY